ncbi:hypothetical protein RSOLAG1IB_10384 [Rhizoctonia solani AG-1 IB]|uniref:Uncharacterized protein n=1 Tax=Thanatephorus cucumeris (strain AG1-IB / isolate 7/3/14) TaxID=1108050 RepID=A0A0B7FWI2_THACB|nr:hypothetical protein RSOLAG1IB_10384 [Rhizoctonia solani AG-1 IB]
MPKATDIYDHRVYPICNLHMRPAGKLNSFIGLFDKPSGRDRPTLDYNRLSIIRFVRVFYKGSDGEEGSCNTRIWHLWANSD